jgi:hypothetical protein
MVIIEMNSNDTPTLTYWRNGTIEHSIGFCAQLKFKNLDTLKGNTTTQNNKSAAPKLKKKIK